MAITLRPITEDNFIDALNLKLKDGQERFVSTQFAVSRRPMSTATSVSRSASTAAK